MHKISINKDKCIGCGACVTTCSSSFDMKDEKAFPTKSEVEKLTCEKDAEAGCPVDAITVS